MALSGSFSTSICDGNYKLLVEWSSSQNVSNNTSVITVKASLVVNWSLNVGERYNNTLSVAGTSVTYKTDPVRTTGTHVLTEYKSGAISHNADGTKSVAISVSYRFNATINGTYYGTMTASKTVTLDTIPRASTPTLSASTIAMGQPVTITTNRASSSFTHKLYYGWYGTTWYSIANNVGASYKWTVPKTFANNIPDATSGWGTIRCETYNGSTLIGTKDVAFKATVPDTEEFSPSCTATLDVIWASTFDTNNLPSSPVQGLSKIKVTVNPTLAYGSPIDSYTILIDGRGYSSSTVTTDYLRNKGSSPVNVVVTDKRGRSGSWKYDMNVQEYARPTIDSLKVHRCDADGQEDDKGDYVKISFSATVSPLTGNTATYLIHRKKSSDTAWTLLTSDVNGNSTASLNNVMSVAEDNATYIYECDGASSWDFRVTAADEHDNGSRSTSVSTAFTLFNVHQSGAGIRFGGVAEKSNAFQNDLDLIQTGNQYCYGTNASNVLGSVAMAKIEITNTNANAPITFELSHRSFPGTMRVHVRFYNESNLTPPLNTIVYEGYNFGAFLVNDKEVETGGNERGSVWTLYVSKVYANDWITVQRVTAPTYMNGRYKITHPGGTVTSIPTPFYRATPAKADQLIDFIFPIGFVLILYNHNDPNDMYPGTTWERIENRFLWATTPGGTIGQIGGASTHTLTESELPVIDGSIATAVVGQHGTKGVTGHAYGTQFGDLGSSGVKGTSTSDWQYGYGYKFGGGAAHNNMPPYIQVSIWHRTA